MNTADLAVIGMAIVSLASIGRDCRLHLKVADRLRLVNPVKAPAPPAAQAETGGSVEDLAKRRPA